MVKQVMPRLVAGGRRHISPATSKTVIVPAGQGDCMQLSVLNHELQSFVSEV